MLSPADADVVRRDGALPGLALLLDPTAFADTLSASLPDAGIGRAEITYLRYKPRTSCLAGFRLTVSGEPVEVCAKAYLPSDYDRLRDARAHPSVQGMLGPGHIILKDAAIVVSVFPNDAELKSLPLLADAPARQRLLRKMLPERPDLWDGPIRNLRYKPHRRYVGQLLDGDGVPTAVLKLYNEHDFPAAQANAKAFAACGFATVARRVGRSSRHRLVALEWVPGQLLSEEIEEPSPALDAVRAAGAALAGLHSQRPKRLPRLTHGAEARTLLAVAADLGAIYPQVAERAARIARRLARRLKQAPPVRVPIHGDFYSKQVVLASDGVVILDLDQAAGGDPAGDLGTFTAHLERDALLGGLPPERVELLKEALIRGYYDDALGVVPSRIDLYTAVGLLRLAPEPFRSRDIDWPTRTEAILKRAGEILG